MKKKKHDDNGPVDHSPPPGGAGHRPGRRRLLTGGVLAGFSALSLPERWFRPVVESVLLPAHAQTSPAESSACQLPLTLADRVVTCDDPAPIEEFFLIDDSGDCPRLVTGSADNASFRIIRDPDAGNAPDNNISLGIRRDPDGLGSTTFNFCPAPDDTNFGQILGPLFATSGATWTLTHTRIESPGPPPSITAEQEFRGQFYFKKVLDSLTASNMSCVVAVVFIPRTSKGDFLDLCFATREKAVPSLRRISTSSF